MRIDGRRVRATTLLRYAGAYQLTLSTAVPALGVELHSSYLGHPHGEAAISHLALTPDGEPATACELLPSGELPVAEDRRRCLYDHLAELQQHVSQTGALVQVELADQALELIDVA